LIERGLSHFCKHTLGDPAVVLNSFIISSTPSQQVARWVMDKAQVEVRNVLFQHEDRATSIEQLRKEMRNAKREVTSSSRYAPLVARC
jgi:hypothetical protein